MGREHGHEPRRSGCRCLLGQPAELEPGNALSNHRKSWGTAERRGFGNSPGTLHRSVWRLMAFLAIAQVNFADAAAAERQYVARSSSDGHLTARYPVCGGATG